MVAIVESPIQEGLPYPQGATWDGEGVNFALFSAHATQVELCLFDGEGETARIALPEYTDENWRGYVPDVHPGTIYGYRVHGHMSPAAAVALIPTSSCLTLMRAGTLAI